MRLPSLFAALPLVLIACGSNDSTPSTDTDDLTNAVDHNTHDVTVLSTAPADGAFIAISGHATVTDGERKAVAGFDAHKCTDLADGRIDCTAEFEKALKVPAFHKIIVSPDQTFCDVILIETVTRADAFDASNGIGTFYSRQTDDDDRGRLIPKAKLLKVQEANLKDGSRGVIHQFGALGVCDVGGRFGTSKFKPYVRIKSGGVQNRNWDNQVVTKFWSDGNYGIEWNTERMDRRSALFE